MHKCDVLAVFPLLVQNGIFSFWLKEEKLPKISRNQGYAVPQCQVVFSMLVFGASLKLIHKHEQYVFNLSVYFNRYLPLVCLF